MTPDGWARAPLARLALHVGRGTPPTYASGASTFYAINQKCVRHGRVAIDHARPHDPAVAVKPDSILRGGDVCVNSTGTGTIGRVGLWDTNDSPIYFADTHVTVVRPNPSAVVPKFLCESLLSPWIQRELENGCFSGSTNQVELNKTAFLDLALLLPPLSEQRKIAAILSSVDDAIEATQAVIDQLQVVKKAMMAELLTRGLPGRHTRFKPTEIGEVPDEWAVVRVADCCTVRNDLRKPINQAERAKIPGPFPYYGPTRAVGSINEWRLDGTFALIGEDGDHFLKFDRWTMTQLVSGRFNVNNHAHVIAGTPRCSAEWFAVFFQHRDLTATLTRQGANRYKLRKATLEELFIPLPSPNEQATIVQSLASNDARAAVEGEVVQSLRELKSALMSVLLTGEVRVTPDQAAA
jgi:type I restriction enzyme, S subunit